MRVLVIGANGRIGRQLVDKLYKSGYNVFAGARKDEGFFSSNIRFEYIDLFADTDEIASHIKGKDVIYFVAGSRGKNLLQIDLHGAIKTMQAAQKCGVKRYIMLSSVFALCPEKWSESFLKDLTDYNIAKHYADLYLSTISKLDFTILQPGILKEETGTGLISVNIEKPASNSIENVVETLVLLLSSDKTVGKVITMHDGEMPIREALQSL